MSEAEQKVEAKKPKGKINWWKVSLWANIAIAVLVVVGVAGGIVLHESDTNPQFCASCHNMQRHVESYMTGTNLDHVHQQANVACKDCHDYSIPQEIDSGIKFITGNYDKSMPRRKFGQEMCLKCHIGLEYQAVQTDFLEKNPHASHWPDLKCTSCHISHGEQVDYCSQCHDNGGQRMIGGEIIPRAENPWAKQTH